MPHTYTPYTVATGNKIIQEALQTRTKPSASVYILVPEPTTPAENDELVKLDTECQAANHKFGEDLFFTIKIPREQRARQQLLSNITNLIENMPSSTIIGPSVSERDLPAISRFFHEGKEGGESLKLFIQTIQIAVRATQTAKGAPLGGKTAFERRYLGTLHKLAQDLTANKKAKPQEVGHNRFVIVVKKPKDENDQDLSYRLIITPQGITMPSPRSNDIAYEGFAESLSSFNPDPSKPFPVVLYHPDEEELEKMVKECVKQGMIVTGAFTNEQEYEAHRKNFDVTARGPVVEEEEVYRRRTVRGLAAPEPII